jgi:hypothetical protein
MKSRVIAALTLANFTLAACSTYVPIAMETVPQVGTVRLALSDDARNQNFGQLGSQIQSIEGRVRSVSDSGIAISANEVGRVDADDQSYRGETVLIPSRYVVAVTQKRVQVARSVLLAALITGGAIWIGKSLGGGSVGYSKPPTPQPGQ